VAVRPANVSPDSPASSSLASITVALQTFGRPKADFPATIQVHSPSLESDLSSTSDKPSSISFPNLPPGQYHVTVTAPSREPAQLELSLASGQSAKVSLIVDRIFPLTLALEAAGPAASLAAPSESASSLALSLSPVSSSTSPSSGPSDPPDADSKNETDHAADSSSTSSASSDDPSPPSDAPPATSQPFVSSCTADEVIPHVSTHVQQFVESINRITATEFMTFERRTRKGKFEEDAKAKANYVAVIQPLDNGALSVEEFRNGSSGMTGFQGHISSSGSVALVLIFHPVHVDEFILTCQGLTYWHNRAVYEITFEQRSDVPNTMSEFRVGHVSYDILLKGTAFVDADSFQILHLDTDLARPIPDILDFEHQSIDYGSISFTTHSDQLWLPQLTTITVRFRNKEFVEHHAYTDYRLFTVDTGQKISKPTIPADPNTPSPN